jgi:beta-glucosidase
MISGSPVEMPWIKEIPALLQGWLNGSEAGNAIVDVLFGDVNPSGKLPFTFPKKLADSPAHANGNYPGENLEVNYEEGLLVGYRYFDTKNVEPLFNFGHGLSYTTFDYSGLKIESAKINKNDSVKVEMTVKNSGKTDGAEVVQCYIRDIKSSLLRPDKELKDFQKIYLKAGEEKKISFTFSGRDFAFYDDSIMDWKVEAGDFELLVGSSSQDIRLTSKFELLD